MIYDCIIFHFVTKIKCNILHQIVNVLIRIKITKCDRCEFEINKLTKFLGYELGCALMGDIVHFTYLNVINNMRSHIKDNSREL